MSGQEAIIYARYSKPEQGLGGSAARQAERCEEVCTTLGLVALPDFTFLERGKSAWTGANRAKGSLLAQIEADIIGDVHRGRWFVVEHLDRITRQGWEEAFAFLQMCSKHGVSVATHDGMRTYPAGERVELGPVIEIIVKTELAREESAKKAGRVLKGIEKRRREARDTGAKVIASRPPAWVIREGGDFALHPVNAPLVREMFELCAAGHGTPEISRRLNERGEATWLGKIGGWHDSYISRILKSREAIGEYHSHKHGERILGYYPPAVTVDLFNRAQAGLQSRKRNKVGRRGICQTSLFSGLTRCGECGSKMYMLTSRRAGRVETKTYRNGRKSTQAPAAVNASYLLCHAARRRLTDDSGKLLCTNKRHIRYERIEPVILDQVLTIALDNDRFNIVELSQARIALAELERQIEAKTAQAANLGENLKNIVSPTLMQQLVTLEGEIAAHRAELPALRSAHAGEQGPSPATLARIADMRANLTSPDFATRRDARVTVSDAMKSIVTSIQCDADGTSTVAIAAGLAGFQISPTGELIAAYDASGDAQIVAANTSGSLAGNKINVGQMAARARAAGRLAQAS